VRLKTTSLKRGLLLYHGTSSPDFDERAGSLAFPAWFSEKERVARYFVNWHGEPEPYPYNEKLPSSARIIVYKVSQPIKVLLIPDGETMDYIRDEMAMADDVETLADWCCSNGYNGWVIPNNYPAEGGSDIMLCRDEGLEYVETKALNESAEDFDSKDVSEPDPVGLVHSIIQNAGITDINVKRTGRSMIFDGILGRYPTHTRDGTKIEVADLCYAQQISWKIAELPQVEKCNATTNRLPDGRKTAHFWVLWREETNAQIQMEAEEIVNNLIEANSAHLEMATRAARWIYQHDPDFFEGGCGDVNHVIKKFLETQQVPVRLLTGYAVFAREKVPHAWLEIDGQQFDPVYTLQRIVPKSYVPKPMDLGDFGVDEESGYHDELVQQLQQAVTLGESEEEDDFKDAWKEPDAWEWMRDTLPGLGFQYEDMGIKHWWKKAKGGKRVRVSGATNPGCVNIYREYMNWHMQWTDEDAEVQVPVERALDVIRRYGAL